MRILVTGGTGFIGSAFLRLALSRGHHVAALVRPGRLGQTRLPADERLTWLVGSVEQTDWRAVAAWRPECLLHTAWIAEPGVYLTSHLNTRYVADSFAFIRQAVRAGATRCVALGTGIEYLPSSSPLIEDVSPLDPHPPYLYARSKQELHERLTAASAEEGWALAWARIFYPYGPGEHPARLYSEFARRLRGGLEVFLKTPGSVRDYIFIDDTVEALLLLCEAKSTGSCNIGTGLGRTIRDVAGIVGRLVGSPGLIREACGGLDAYPHVVADSGRLRKLGWVPRVSLETGLEQLIGSLPLDAPLCAP